MEGNNNTVTGGGGVDLDLPGFRFHPTEEELLDFYLRRAVTGKRFHFEIIPTVHLYRYDPADLPGLAKIGGEREWYFFVPRDRKQGNGGRPNRTTARGFWKATGCDRPIRSGADPKRLIGLKKTLVFYRGRAPRGTKTDWVMNEYRLPDTTPLTKEDIVLCKIYRKATSLKELEQRAAMEAGMRVLQQEYYPSKNTISFSYEENYNKVTTMVIEEDEEKEMNYELLNKDVEESSSLTSSLQSMSHEEVKLQRNGSLEDTLEWLHDPFFTQLHSPNLIDQCWSPYPNAFNF